MSSTLLMLSVLGAVVVLDQTTKASANRRLQDRAATIGGVGLRLVANRGFPWGSTAGVRALTVLWVLMIVSGTIVAARLDVVWASIALGASLGGATGNVIDGNRRCAVIDFIDLRVWPVFNLADAAIVGSAVFAGWNLLQLA